MDFTKAYLKPYSQHLIYRLWEKIKPNQDLVIKTPYGVKMRYKRTSIGVFGVIE